MFAIGLVTVVFVLPIRFMPIGRMAVIRVAVVGMAVIRMPVVRMFALAVLAITLMLVMRILAFALPLAIRLMTIGAVLAIALVSIGRMAIRGMAVRRMPVVGVAIVRVAVILMFVRGMFALGAFAFRTIALIGLMAKLPMLAIGMGSMGDVAIGMAAMAMAEPPGFFLLFLLQKPPVHILLGDDAGFDLLLQGFPLFLFLEVALESLLLHFFAFAKQEGQIVIFGVDLDAIGNQKPGRDAQTLDPGMGKGAVIDVARAARGRIFLKNRDADSKIFAGFERGFGPGIILGGDVFARLRQDAVLYDFRRFARS
jgi:hypothetical protein